MIPDHWNIVRELLATLKPTILRVTHDGQDSWTVRDYKDDKRVATGVTDEEMGEDFNIMSMPDIQIGTTGMVATVADIGKAAKAMGKLFAAKP